MTYEERLKELDLLTVKKRGQKRYLIAVFSNVS